jgi:aspartyl-tRNA(Asn)/glutamyl-tRNA(Gln) amidotransferase subunit C
MERETVVHIARLARLGLTESELEHFGEQLTDILDYVEALKQVDVEGIPPFNELEETREPGRRDEVTNKPSEAGELAQAPQREGRFIVTPSPLVSKARDIQPN